MATAELVLQTAIDALTRGTLVVANLLGMVEAEIPPGAGQVVTSIVRSDCYRLERQCRAGFAPAEEWRLRTAHDQRQLLLPRIASQFLLPNEGRSRPLGEGPTTPLSVSCQPAPVLTAVKAHRFALPPLRGADGLDGGSAQAPANSWPTGAQHDLYVGQLRRSQPKTISTILLRQPGNILI